MSTNPNRKNAAIDALMRASDALQPSADAQLPDVVFELFREALNDHGISDEEIVRRAKDALGPEQTALDDLSRIRASEAINRILRQRPPESLL